MQACVRACVHVVCAQMPAHALVDLHVYSCESLRAYILRFRLDIPKRALLIHEPASVGRSGAGGMQQIQVLAEFRGRRLNEQQSRSSLSRKRRSNSNKQIDCRGLFQRIRKIDWAYNGMLSTRFSSEVKWILYPEFSQQTTSQGNDLHLLSPPRIQTY